MNSALVTSNPAIFYSAIIDVPVMAAGFKLGIVCTDTILDHIDFLSQSCETQAPVSALAHETGQQLQAYFRDPGFQFNLPLAQTGTVFQQRVWHAMRSIPAGVPQTYGELAQRLNSSARAVGGACRRNPLPIVVPCHRVVAKQGLGGFVGATQGPAVKIKQWLLAHETCS